MTVEKLVEKLKQAPQSVEAQRGDSDCNGDITETPVNRVEIILGEDEKHSSVTIY